MTLNYIATRRVDDITQSFIFNLENLNKTPADLSTLTTQVESMITTIMNLDNAAWTTGSLVKHVVSTAKSKADISDWRTAVDVTIILKNYNAVNKAAYYYRKIENVATTAIATQIATFITNINSGLTTNNFYIQSIIINEHL